MFFKALFVTQVLFELFNCRANGNAPLGLSDSKGENATVEDPLYYSDVNGSFPFLVSIKKVGNKTAEDICPGILINSSTVLTSYCASNNTKEDLEIVLTDKNSEIIRKVSRITLHPHHGLNNESDIKQVVLITLDIPINRTEMIDIGQNLTKSMVSKGTNCNAFATNNVSDHESGNFRSYNMSLIDWVECKSKHDGSSLNEWEHVCAKLNYPGNICLTDGSPLICEGKVLGYRPLSTDFAQCSKDRIAFVRLDSIKDVLTSKEQISSSNESDVISDNSTPTSTTIKPQENIATIKGPNKDILISKEQTSTESAIPSSNPSVKSNYSTTIKPQENIATIKGPSKDILISKEQTSTESAIPSSNPSVKSNYSTTIKLQDNNTTMKGIKCWSESENSTVCDSPLNKSQETFPVQNETEKVKMDPLYDMIEDPQEMDEAEVRPLNESKSSLDKDILMLDRDSSDLSLEKIAKMKSSKDLQRSSSNRDYEEMSKAIFTCSPSLTTSLVLVCSLITRLGVLFK